MYHPKEFHVECKNVDCWHDVKDEEGKIIGREQNAFDIETPTALTATCPHCNESHTYVIPDAPVVRSQLKPIGSIQVYPITSDEIKVHLIQKIAKYRPGAKLEIGVKYCERKNSGRDGNPNRAYASLTIGFSDDVIDQKSDTGWFDKIGESEANIRFIKDVYKNFIEKYQYDRKELDIYLNDYKELERLEDRLGVTESFLEDIRMYTIPKRIKTTAKESWIFFSARPERIIEDMLQNQYTDTVEGRVHINEVYQINKDVVQFIVYVHPSTMGYSENPLVRQMLTGQRNIKDHK